MRTVPPLPGTTGFLQGGTAHMLFCISQSVRPTEVLPSTEHGSPPAPQDPMMSNLKILPGFELKKMCGWPFELTANVTEYQSSSPCGGKVPFTLVWAPTLIVPPEVAAAQLLPPPPSAHSQP